MSETVEPSPDRDVQQGGDASARVTTGGVIEAPEAGGARSRWTPSRIAYTAVLAAVVIFLAVKAADDLRQFVVVTLNGVTLAALYFVVASGFTLIFGLMRVVNMAHGSLYLLGGYLALKMQESWFQEETGLNLSLSGATDAEYGLAGWLVPLLLATLAIGLIDRKSVRVGKECSTRW